jgi:hypothetical protein
MRWGVPSGNITRSPGATHTGARPATSIHQGAPRAMRMMALPATPSERNPQGANKWKRAVTARSARQMVRISLKTSMQEPSV